MTDPTPPAEPQGYDPRLNLKGPPPPEMMHTAEENEVTIMQAAGKPVIESQGYDPALSGELQAKAATVSDFAADPARWPSEKLVRQLAAQLRLCEAALEAALAAARGE